jgi:NAD(P)H-dependent FMN reductase
MTKQAVSVLLICGSHRQDSMTRIAMRVLIARLQHHGAQCEVFDPAAVQPSTCGVMLSEVQHQSLLTAVGRCSAVVLCTPEYNGSFSALIKSIIEHLGYPSTLAGKPTALLGVASGGIGAVKALEHLQSVCLHNGAVIVPPYVSIHHVEQQFDQQGNCTNSRILHLLDRMANTLLAFAKA